MGGTEVLRKLNEKKCLTFPRASKPLSKNRSTARKVKNIPNPIRPRPISASIFVNVTEWDDKFSFCMASNKQHKHQKQSLLLHHSMGMDP